MNYTRVLHLGKYGTTNLSQSRKFILLEYNVFQFEVPIFHCSATYLSLQNFSYANFRSESQ